MTSQDPVNANTYPNLTGGDAWTYTWTTFDADHPCSDLVYTITVNENQTGPVTIFTPAGGPVPGASWLTLLLIQIITVQELYQELIHLVVVTFKL